MSPESRKVAVVTGACGAIGQAIARRLAHDGHCLLLLDVNPAVERLAQAFLAENLAARAIALDISDPAQVARLDQLAGDWFGRIAVLVNNAGISPKYQGKKRPVVAIPYEEWQQVINVNLTGTFLVTQKLLPPMLARRWGRIVMISSQAARTRTLVPAAHYQASKAAMVALARVLAGELGPQGITVNSVAPGRIATSMTAQAGASANAEIAEATPVGRMGHPEEVAAAVAFLCSDQASYACGAIIDINGGHFMP
jgi:3-oxoacyl-[acyl-carrier protein] reductase